MVKFLALNIISSMFSFVLDHRYSLQLKHSNAHGVHSNERH